jgi:hypothetical protein
MCPESALVIILPIPGVLLIGCDPHHDALPVSLVESPLALVVVPRLIGHLPTATLHATLPVTLVDGPVTVPKYARTVS